MGILTEKQEQETDHRRWELALKAQNPVEAYEKMVRDDDLRQDDIDIETLPDAQKEWLRAK